MMIIRSIQHQYFGFKEKYLKQWPKYRPMKNRTMQQGHSTHHLNKTNQPRCNIKGLIVRRLYFTTISLSYSEKDALEEIKPTKFKEQVTPNLVDFNDYQDPLNVTDLETFYINQYSNQGQTRPNEVDSNQDLNQPDPMDFNQTQLNDQNMSFQLHSLDKTTHFGFTQVPSSQKSNFVHDVFSSVAPSYDIMNDAMSLGIHRLWKDQFVNMIHPLRGQKILDVAGGTGDIAFRIIDKMLQDRTCRKMDSNLDSGSDFSNHEDASQVVVLDINQSMLHQGKVRYDQSGQGKGLIDLQWVLGDAEMLPISSNSIDTYSISFGIRNCTDIHRVLGEAYRVLKPGGRFACLEFSQVRTPILHSLYDFYSFNIIPLLGKIIANQQESYQYLVESIQKFPDQERFQSMIEDSGFHGVSHTELSFGIATIHIGFKPMRPSSNEF